MNKNMQTKLTAAIEAAWPGERACIYQLQYEGAHWDDEGTRLVLWAWDDACDSEVEVAVFPINAELELEELEECFAGMDSYVQDKDWEIQS
jgi:hypothetical protein